MAEINTVIAEASQDLQTIEDFVNLPADSDVRPRLLPSVNVGTLAGIRDAIFRAGGLPAEPFETKTEMETKGASLPNGQLAQVYNETANNGLYVKTAGVWVKSDYDPLTQAKAVVAEATKYIAQTGSAALHQWTDENDLVVGSINSNAEFEAQDFKTERGSLSTVVETINQIDIPGYAHVFNDSNGNVLMGIKQDGSIDGGSSGGSGLAEMRADILNSVEMNEVGFILDAKLYAETPINMDVTVANWDADGGTGSRMPCVFQSDKNELCVIYSRMASATNESGQKMYQRFVTYDLDAKTYTVSEGIMLQGNNPDGSLHSSNVEMIRRVDGDVSLIHMEVVNDVWVLQNKISKDKCRTWGEPTTTILPLDTTYMVGNGLTRIQGGMYNNRLVLALWGGNRRVDGVEVIGGNISCLYSDDEGITWKRGGTLHDIDFDEVNTLNETSVACDASNNLIFVTRNEQYGSTPPNAYPYIVFSISRDGGKTLEKYGKPRFEASASQMGIMQAAPSIYSGVPKMFISSPTTLGFSRRSFRIKMSYDNFKSLAINYAPYPENLNIGYSYLLMLNKSTFVVAVEDGTEGQRNIKLKFLNLAEII